jgi:1-aminocyclopropane-1-carboxylate deaminase/D-cysteine desulfhydrase-like pyridoxal-dependent ACC family enzyme
VVFPYFDSVLQYEDTPVQEIHHETLDKAGIQLWIKREDLNHASVSGNKWWKLKYNLEEAGRMNYRTILTFGGAYSNHIFSTSAAAKECGLKSIGIIRGERVEPLNRTLAFAEHQGMQLHFVSREMYRTKNDPAFTTSLQEKFGDFFLVPEGGTNTFAIRGCEEFAKEKLSQVSFDILMLPVGTGGTMAGIIAGLEDSKEILGVSVLKKGDFLKDEISDLLKKYSGTTYGNWSLLTSYDHGGYAKVTQELLGLVNVMKMQHNLPLDTVYTGKLMSAVLKEAERGRFSRGTTVLALHTGGLQGNYA